MAEQPDNSRKKLAVGLLALGGVSICAWYLYQRRSNRIEVHGTRRLSAPTVVRKPSNERPILSRRTSLLEEIVQEEVNRLKKMKEDVDQEILNESAQVREIKADASVEQNNNASKAEATQSSTEEADFEDGTNIFVYQPQEQLKFESSDDTTEGDKNTQEDSNLVSELNEEIKHAAQNLHLHHVEDPEEKREIATDEAAAESTDVMSQLVQEIKETTQDLHLNHVEINENSHENQPEAAAESTDVMSQLVQEIKETTQDLHLNHVEDSPVSPDLHDTFVNDDSESLFTFQNESLKDLKVRALSNENLYEFGKQQGLTRLQTEIAVALFFYVDTDNSGEVEKEELLNTFKSLLETSMSQSLITRLGEMKFNDVDNDHSGSIDVREFITLYANFLKDYIK